MIAVVHGPRGCGKTTALRNWLRSRGWMPPRGFRTHFDGPLFLSPWEEGAPSCEIMGNPVVSGGLSPSSRPCPARARDPGFGPALESFLDAVFIPPAGSPPCAALQVQAPEPAFPPPPAVPLPPQPFDARAYWRAALAALDGDPARPLVIDELGLLETLPGALDPTALRRLLSALHAAPRAIVVVQERALGFWLRALGGTPDRGKLRGH